MLRTLGKGMEECSPAVLKGASHGLSLLLHYELQPRPELAVILITLTSHPRKPSATLCPHTPCSTFPHPLPTGPHIQTPGTGVNQSLTPGFPSLPQDLVVPTSAARMAGASPRAWCVTTGDWTTVETAATRGPGHQPAVEVSDAAAWALRNSQG